MSKTLCPKCSDILPIDARACACGWRKDAVRVKGEVNLDCPFNDHGHICGKRGSMSESTIGGGPWYCSDHWWILKGNPNRSLSPIAPMSYRERWYLEHGLPYEPPRLSEQIPMPKRREREPGEDEEYNLATQA